MSRLTVALLAVLLALGHLAAAEGAAQEIDRLAYEPVLLPVWSTGIEGAYGTSWMTTLGVANPHDSPVLGFANIECPFECGTDFLVAPHDVKPLRLLSPPSAPPATVIFVRREPNPALHYTLLLRRGSAVQLRAIATIPVVREAELLDRTFFIPAVPVEPDVRYRLRLYDLSEHPAVASVRVHGDFVGQVVTEWTVTLSASAGSFVPSYAEIALDGLPVGSFRTFSIEVTPTDPERAQMWALLTATHNESQDVLVFVP